MQVTPSLAAPNGAVLLAGGGRLGPEIFETFVERAGGGEATIVVIPTAGADDEYTEANGLVAGLQSAGAWNLTVLHTRSREEADSPEFSRALRQADGVWISGGRQWRLVDAYLHTRVHREILGVLERGGVVGGTSAGASILASYLIRGDPATNEIVMAPGYEEGFGALEGAAVDQHLFSRGREMDLLEVVELHPELMGIGLDEGTALLIEGAEARVLGESRVAIYNIRRDRGPEGEGSLPPPLPFLFLNPGDRFQLDSHEVVRFQQSDH
ncbi:MAG: cyanophycinase [Gemmatimonadota bacterium]